MTTRRAAVYGGGALLVAWLAAANSFPVREDTTARDRARLAAASGTQALSAEVQQQATRLHQLIAEAPAPTNNPRNLFAFGAPRTAPSKPNLVEATSLEAPAPPAAPASPALLLMGIAEDAKPDGVQRTAVISGDGDALFMVKEGDTVADRYRVAKIGADAVELEDLTVKGSIRRLALR
jgi:hypothetical protein